MTNINKEIRSIGYLPASESALNEAKKTFLNCWNWSELWIQLMVRSNDFSPCDREAVNGVLLKTIDIHHKTLHQMQNLWSNLMGHVKFLILDCYAQPC